MACSFLLLNVFVANILLGQSMSNTDWKSAARYLDQRQLKWFQWDRANRGETSCVACHTGLAYAMARPALRDRISNPSPSDAEKRLIKNVHDRVNDWNNVTLYYDSSDLKKTESRGTESIINALIIAQFEADRAKLSDQGKRAMKHMWYEQIQSGPDDGIWHWLHFGSEGDYEPWESKSAKIYGASLAAIAVGTAPGQYSKTETIQSPIQRLRLRLAGAFKTESLHNQIYILWAETTLGNILSQQQKSQLLTKMATQQNEDGGWSTAKLGDYRRSDETALNLKSDGYATGLVVYVRKLDGMMATDHSQARAKIWLEKNQLDDGRWLGNSVHRLRDANTHLGKFTSDAATAFALLGLMAYDN